MLLSDSIFLLRNFERMNKKVFFLPVLAVALVVGIAQAQKPDNDVRPGHYIVVLKDTVTDSRGVSEELGRTHGLEIAQTYRYALKGFAAMIPDARLDMVKKDPRVAFVGEDRVVRLDPTESADAAPSNKGGKNSSPSQTMPTGIRRIGANGLANKGAGVAVAILDTGIDLTHPDLVANIGSAGKTCVSGTTSANDDNGHGTHVAGTIAAVNNTLGVVGVAPGAKLYAVKVLDRSGSGYTSGIICGIDWVTANAATYGIKVVNMSIGGTGTSDNNCGLSNGDAYHQAICRSTAKGVTYVVSAGNSSIDASKQVPAAYDDTVIAVSALADSDGAAGGVGGPTGSGSDDTFATFSNYGASVDIGAPGVSIYSTYKGGTYSTMSGTSMASPHVAGAAALYIAAHPGATWSLVRDALNAAGELLGAGHTDPTRLHPESVLKVSAF